MDIVHVVEDQEQRHASLVWIGQFLFMFSVSNFLVFKMILFHIPKFDFVSNVKKFRFRNSQSKQRTHIDFLKNSYSKQK